MIAHDTIIKQTLDDKYKIYNHSEKCS